MLDDIAPEDLTPEERARRARLMRESKGKPPQKWVPPKTKTMGTTKVESDDYYSETYATGGRVRMRDGIAVRGKTRGKIY